VRPLFPSGVADRGWKRGQRAAIPFLHRFRDLRFNPRPWVALFHMVKGYETKGRWVPSVSLIPVPADHFRFAQAMHRLLA
jgi:hypothetical protein